VPDIAPPKILAARILNVPNQITAVRLVLAIAVFLLIPMRFYVAAVLVFLLAASTDWIDGWYARRYDQVTKVGRIFDPFVDKIIICGTFVYLAAQEHLGSGIAPWMAVVVMGREMLVTAIRSFVEQYGGDFSAKWAGKWKMVFQCAAVVASLLALMWNSGTAPTWLPGDLPVWLPSTLAILVWTAIGLTLWSGIEYIVAILRIIARTPIG
jgi:CDP-diacylglycerol---glycerol-3-phosphate 3-phosphatidyltransferase